MLTPEKIIAVSNEILKTYPCTDLSRFDMFVIPFANAIEHLVNQEKDKEIAELSSKLFISEAALFDQTEGITATIRNDHIADLDDRLAKALAKIDSLMFKYCPDEMTGEQIWNYRQHQKPAPAHLQSISAAKGDE